MHLGDHWDMASLSSWDRGKKSMEGRRYNADITAGNLGMAILNAPLNRYNEQRRAYKEKQWWPRRVLLRGNHEERILRACEDDAALDGVIGYHDLESPGWETHEFLEVVNIDGVAYSHYFYNPMSGRPYSAVAATRLKQVGRTFTMGHQQTLDYAIRFVGDKAHHGLIAGACYLHDEGYKGPQGNAHWRGVIVKHQVEDGEYDPMFVSLDYLCRRYEGISLNEWKEKNPCS